MLAVLFVLLEVVRNRLRPARTDDGASAIELVVIGGVLLLLALLVAAAIKAAVDNRITLIQ